LIYTILGFFNIIFQFERVILPADNT